MFKFGLVDTFIIYFFIKFDNIKYDKIIRYNINKKIYVKNYITS